MRLYLQPAILLACSLITGCTTPYSKLSIENRDQLLSSFVSGESEMACGWLSGYGEAASAANGLERQRGFFESGQWSKMAIDVLSIKFGGDKEWFYLGRAGEGLGYLDAGIFYYEESLSKGIECKCIGFACSNLTFPDVVNERLVAVQEAKKNHAKWSSFERSRHSELSLQSHVSFYQCNRWANGQSTSVLQGFLAAAAAGTAAGVFAGSLYGSTSVGKNALTGAYYATSAEATANIYRGIGFPDVENQGKDFAYLFDECMAKNGLYTKADRSLMTGWTFTENETTNRAGLRGSLLLVRSSDSNYCDIKLSYLNSHSAITNATIEITVFDVNHKSLSEHVLAFPSIFPSRSHSVKLDLQKSSCHLVNMAYISSATDQISGKEISEMKGSEVTLCESNSMLCSP